jgi:hypothetical protein
MPLTPTATRTGTYAVRYDWTGTAPFDVWQDGIRVLSGTTLTTYTAQTTDGTSNPLPAVEITDVTDTALAESERFSPRVKFQWRGQSDASYYRIQQYLDSEWTSIGMVKENGTGYYSWESTAQTDGSSAQFRVVPYDTRGYDGLPLTITHAVVCNPAPPAVSYSYSAGTGLLTIAAG